MDEENPMKGPAGAHMKFAGELRLTQVGGQLTVPDSGAEEDDTQLSVSNAKEITLRLTAATDFSVDKLDFDRNIDPLKVCERILNEAGEQSDKSLLKRHIAELSGCPVT